MQLSDISVEERKAVFLEISAKIGIRPDMVEKDFWVTWTLNRFFQNDHIAKVLLFKGGTSLSKAFHVIHRFSEDIDLLLDLREVADSSETFEKERTRNAINTFKSKTQKRTAAYITENLLPKIKKLVAPICSVEQDKDDFGNIYIKFPSAFESVRYIRPNIKLEVGAFAKGTPWSKIKINSYVKENIPIFEELQTEIPTVSITRTFWEKITVLHYLHFLPEDRQVPLRHSRHFYDLFMLAHSDYKKDLIASSILLDDIIGFDRKYYAKRGVDYDDISLKTLSLMPRDNQLSDLKKDYDQMSDMIFGEEPSWDAILQFISELEAELHSI